MRPTTSLPMLGLLALGMAWGTTPASAQSLTINLADLLAGRGPVLSTAPGNPYLDPYQADRPAYPYGPGGYGSPYDPQGYRPPSLPEHPPYGAFPPQAGFGRPDYRDAYRPPFPGPGPGFDPGYGPGFDPGYRPGPMPPTFGVSPRLIGLADTLVGQSNDFLQVFAPTAGVVPEGRQFLADAQNLAAAADRFRQVAASGAAPGQLSQEIRGVEGAWQRLQQRTQRVARGRTGPNIQQVGLMGNTLQQIRQVLP